MNKILLVFNGAFARSMHEILLVLCILALSFFTVTVGHALKVDSNRRVEMQMHYFGDDM